MYRGEPSKHYYDFAAWNPTFDTAVSSDGWVHSRQTNSVVPQLGATSTGQREQTVEWRILKKGAGSSSGQPLFINAKTAGGRSVSFKQNPPRQDYAFGKGTLGWGYYSLETREGWEILKKRFQRKESIARAELESFHLGSCCFGLCGALPRDKLEVLHGLQEKLSEIRKQKADAERRLRANGPESPRTTSLSDAPPYSFTQSVLWGAAACGGVI
jgi:hypothetical protein